MSLSTTSFAGGHRSGLAVVNPGDLNPKLIVRVYTDGFLLDGTDFRSLDEQRNIDFLRALRAGEVPNELIERVRSSGWALDAQLSDIDRCFNPDIDLNTPKPVVRELSESSMFRGHGCSLNSSSVSGHVSVDPVNLHNELGHPPLDDSQSKTTIQIRFPSGNRCKRTFNSGAIAISLVELIALASGVPAENIILYAGFPPCPIQHSELRVKTIEDAGLCNSAITVSFI